MDDFGLQSLKEGREAFHAYINSEKDPVKQEKLKEFLVYVDKSLDIYELNWFRTKAIQTADATRTLLNQKEEQLAFKKKQKLLWEKRLQLFWGIFFVVSVIIIWTGFGTVYVYTLRDGSEVVSHIYEGEKVVVDRVPLKFKQEKIGFPHQPFLRISGIFIGFCALSGFSLYKMANL